MKRFNTVTILLFSFLMISSFAFGSSFEIRNSQYSGNQIKTSDYSSKTKQKAETICKNFVIEARKIYEARQQGISHERVMSILDTNIGQKYGQDSFMFQFLKKATNGIYGELSHLTKKDLLNGYYQGCYMKIYKQLK
ncbi:hypothetical protein PBI_SCTP2_466 [Salicola phage SCTP-2]|nr:hypothetical protein PBI_SCTP2_466 [Salicola phage SCTP-2]